MRFPQTSILHTSNFPLHPHLRAAIESNRCPHTVVVCVLLCVLVLMLTLTLMLVLVRTLLLFLGVVFLSGGFMVMVMETCMFLGWGGVVVFLGCLPNDSLVRLPFDTHQVVRYLFVVFALRLPRRLLRPPPGSGEAKTLTLTLRILLRDSSSSSSSSWTSMMTPPKMKQRGKGGKKLASRTEGRDRGTREGNTRRKLSPKYEQGPSPR